MTRVEAHEADCHACQHGYKDHCLDREAAEFLDDLQAAVALWPQPRHLTACASWGAVTTCNCRAGRELAARKNAFSLLGIDQ